ncbi:hypothetical protein ACHAXS_013952 [Conticribra weissflogii]
MMYVTWGRMEKMIQNYLSIAKICTKANEAWLGAGKSRLIYKPNLMQNMISIDLLMYVPTKILKFRYLTPERHIVEYILAVIISSTMIRALLPKLPRYPDDKADNLTPPIFIKIPTGVIVLSQLIYKISGYPGKVLFIFMPCNVMWTMWAFLCFWPNLNAQTMHILYQLIVPYSGLAVAAVATPDTSDLTMWGEVPFFFLMHYTLIIYTIYFLSSGKVTVLPIIGSNDNMVGNFLKWWAFTCACFAFFYFGIATPLSLIYGLNVNYMLHPPPTPGDIISGQNFRLQSTLVCAVSFFFFRFLATFGEVCTNAFCRITVYRSKKKA